MDIPGELIEQLRKGNVILFCGAGISATDGGLPTGGQLTQELIERTHLDELKGHPLPEVAQAYELRMGRHSLIAYLASRIEDSCCEPLSVHHLIAALPFKGIITTNWDNLLEEALYQAKKPTLKVVRDTDIPFADDEKVLLIKLHGSIEQKDSIVVTGDDYYDVFAHLPETAKEVSAYFAKKTILFLGFGLADDDFGRLYREVVRHLGRHQRRAYAVQLAPSQLNIQQWQQKNVQIIDAHAAEFLKALRGQLSPQKTRQQWMEQGLALMDNKRYREALAAFEMGIELDPDWAEADLYACKGQALRGLNRDEEALGAYELAIQVYAHNAEALVGKAETLWYFRHYDGSLACYEHAFRLAPELVWKRINEINTPSNSKRTHHALARCELNIKWNNNVAHHHFRKCLVLIGLGKFSEALISCEHTLKLEDSFIVGHYCRILLLEHMERYREALEECKQAINYREYDTFAWRKKGDMLKRLGRGIEAEEAYKKAEESEIPF